MNTSKNPIAHTNRRGKTYYLHAATTKKGAVRYVMKTKPEGALTAVPEGMEIVEGPNGEVSARRIQPQEINPLEIQLVEAKLAALGLLGYRAAAKGQDIVVYEPQRTIEDLREIADIVSGGQMAETRHLSRIFPELGSAMDAVRAALGVEMENTIAARAESLVETSRVEPILRFTLKDKKGRIFSVDRMTFRGSGGWRWLSAGMPLGEAADTYLKHLGKDSFFEPM